MPRGQRFRPFRASVLGIGSFWAPKEVVEGEIRALQGVAFAGKSLQLKTMAGLHTVSIPIEEDEGKPLEIT